MTVAAMPKVPGQKRPRAIYRRMRKEQRDALITHAIQVATVKTPAGRGRTWTPGEDAFMIQNLGYMTDAEIGRALGRSRIAVHLRWDRDLGLPGPSKNPEVITANKAADALGIDGHKTAAWVDWGLLPGRLMAGGRNIRLIRRVAFVTWACSPANWIYFDITKVQDPHLKRLIELRAKRWGDAWWSTLQAAKYHGVDTQEIKRYIQLGRLPGAVRLPYSKGGRHKNRHWSNWAVLRSEVVSIVIFNSHDAPNNDRTFTPAADAWILRAHDELRLDFNDIARTMKRMAGGDPKRVGRKIDYRYKQLKALEAKFNRRKR